jgi:hypothetical protein
MLYFDWLSHKHFGSIRQQIWAFLHFPFHLALVLLMEGTAQFIIWRKIIEVLAIISDAYTAAVTDWYASPTTDATDLINTLNDTTQAFFLTYPPTYTKTYLESEAVLEAMATATDENAFYDAIIELGNIVQSSLYTTYGIVAPEDKKSTTEASVTEELSKQQDVFSLVVSEALFHQSYIVFVPKSPSHPHHLSSTSKPHTDR